MIVDGQLYMAVLYHNPSDFPGLYVGRYHKIGVGVVIPDPEPFAVAPTIEEVRQAMSPGNEHRLAPSEHDDATIVEVWV